MEIECHCVGFRSCRFGRNRNDPLAAALNWCGVKLFGDDEDVWSYSVYSRFEQLKNCVSKERIVMSNSERPDSFEAKMVN